MWSQPCFRPVIALFGLALSLGACAPAAPSTPTPAPLTVAAAADLQFAFTEIGARYTAVTGVPVIFSFGSTGQLAQQIENGAPFDVFAAANQSFVEALARQNLALTDTVQLYARGHLVLAVNRQAGLTVTRLDDLLNPAVRQIAIANPAHAPYGMAAQQALESAGLWSAVTPKLVFGDNVRQALQFVQSGDAPVGIVALSVADVPEITWTLIDDSLHAPLDQALAVMAYSPRQAEARRFAAFINGPEGRPIMQRYGFMLPGEAVNTPAP